MQREVKANFAYYSCPLSIFYIFYPDFGDNDDDDDDDDMIRMLMMFMMIKRNNVKINCRELPTHLPLPSLASLSLDHNRCKSSS